jgi:hypothetical protein
MLSLSCVTNEESKVSPRGHESWLNVAAEDVLRELPASGASLFGDNPPDQADNKSHRECP